MHLHDLTLRRYVAGQLYRDEVVLIDQHVANCVVCARALAERGCAGRRWERRGLLQRLVRVP